MMNEMTTRWGTVVTDEAGDKFLQTPQGQEFVVMYCDPAGFALVTARAGGYCAAWIDGDGVAQDEWFRTPHAAERKAAASWGR